METTIILMFITVTSIFVNGLAGNTFTAHSGSVLFAFGITGLIIKYFKKL